jgi:tRNA A37 threonylcarbamoyladenosine synthetase subunit TsaC/SUA5/YrdC
MLTSEQSNMSRPTKGRTIPVPGTFPNAERDAQEVFAVLKSGGVVILPTDVGYGIMSSSAEGIERAFAAKRRAPGHTLGIIGTYQQHRELHVLPEEKFEITRVIMEEHGQVIAVVAPYNHGHPRLKRLSPQTMERITRNNTIGIALSVSQLLRELGRLNDEDGQLMVGSSANISGQGQKYRVEDIEPEVLEAADLIVDYGLQHYHIYGRASINIDMVNMKVLRIGAGYEVFRHRMKKWFDVDLPEDPEHRTDDVGVAVSVKPEG